MDKTGSTTAVFMSLILRKTNAQYELLQSEYSHWTNDLDRVNNFFLYY